MNLYFLRHGVAVDREDPSVSADEEQPRHVPSGYPLGAWHDCAVLDDCVANFIADFDFLADHANFARLLLTEIETKCCKMRL